MASRDNLIWLDLEMTGLDPRTCVIVEIATLVTDADLNVIAEGPNLVVQASAAELAVMTPFVVKMHERSGLLERIAESDITLAQAEEASLAFIQEHSEKGASPLCGNSIWKDRQFIERYMPRFSEHLHYRNIDVSTLKELVRRWYPTDSAPKKKEAHRALTDIVESIAELRWYRSRVFKNGADQDTSSD